MLSSANAQTPWVSYCIATYRRQSFLQGTLAEILQQTGADLEVIVSDNDPEGSSRIVIESFADPRIHYVCAGTNVGMVRNFNRALALARGEYVAMVCDDDPVYPDMLKTLHALAMSYPGYGAYYGAPAIARPTTGCR